MTTTRLLLADMVLPDQSEPVSWSWDDLYQSMSPSQQRNCDRRMGVTRKTMKIMRRLPWLRWPLIRLATDFWITLADEGLVSVCKPRWGMLTFAYLNDGMRPTLWHTAQEIFGGQRYRAIYPYGAPRNRYEADNYGETARSH